MNSQPSEWKKIIAAEGFAQISTTGKKVKTKDCAPIGKYPVVDQGQEMIGGYVDDSEKLISTNEPLIVFGDHTRAVKWVDFSFVPGADGTKILQAEPYLLPRFAYHQLRSLEIPNKGYSRHFKFLKELEFSVPPLPEQKVIADKLDILLAQVENTKARLERIPQILKRFRQSVLAAAVSGRLTEDFSASDHNYYHAVDQDIAEDKKLVKIQAPKVDEIELAKELFESPDWHRWKLYALEQLVESSRGIPYGIVQTGEAQDDGIPTIRCGDVKPLLVETKSLKKVLPEIEEKYARTRLKGGEVVLAIRGTVGNAAVISEELAAHPLNISREVAMIPIRKNISSQYVALLLQSPGGYGALAEKTKGVAQRGINLADVKRLVTPLPTLSEQTEIVRRVDQLFAHADRIEQQVHNALARVNNLTQSILAKAFRGELTEQWRKDNPELISGENSAEALLERIKAERAAQKPAGRRTKIRKTEQAAK